jgi:BMFP domain-containing protein YqiC
MTTPFLQDLQQKMQEFVKNSPLADADKNIKAGMQQMLSKMEIVTREEFDTQVEITLRLRERIAQLEERIKHIELQHIQLQHSESQAAVASKPSEQSEIASKD